MMDRCPPARICTIASLARTSPSASSPTWSETGRRRCSNGRIRPATGSRRRLEELAALTARLTAGLQNLGVGHGDTVVMMMRNRPEFHAIDLAVLFCGATPVSIYNSSAPEQIEYLVNDCKAKVAIIEDSGFLERFLKVRAEMPTLEQIVLIEPSDLAGDDVIRYSDLAAFEPVDLAAEAETATLDDLATIIYTSGTTGPPKGVMLSHSNVLWTLESVGQIMRDQTDDHRLRGEAARVVPADGPHHGAAARALLPRRLRHARGLLSGDVADGGRRPRRASEPVRRRAAGVGEAPCRRQWRARRRCGEEEGLRRGDRRGPADHGEDDPRHRHRRGTGHLGRSSTRSHSRASARCSASTRPRSRSPAPRRSPRRSSPGSGRSGCRSPRGTGCPRRWPC